MFRIGICFLLFIAFSSTVQADEKLKAAVLKSAGELRAAFLQQDYAKVIDWLYPGAVKELGGREKVLAQIQEAMKQVQAKGVEFKDTKLGEPGEFYPEGDNLFVIIPTKIEMQAREFKIFINSYYLGISADKGQHWTFFGQGFVTDQAAMLKLLPKLPEKLVLPPADDEPEVVPVAK